ncbi:nuclear transcription factor Y subunit beta [Drosophila innubila]|uniref:nuclear transcription factor Y subunit beta n=1 Tax=Drosophila innubila TaxID=198719 RepID=UPI00148C4A84|nr:nuclear transcription factor Y subunit beta [Drosophila innubila]
MAPSHMDYPHNENANESESNVGYTHKKFNTGCYKHKKFGKRISKDDPPTAPPLFRPYALSENTPRKRRQEVQQPQHQLPPTPPTTPPQQQQQQSFQQQQQQSLQKQQQQSFQQQHFPQQQFYVPTATPTPVINHQAYAFVLQKQRTVLQMRQMLSINPDANTWPTELRNALYSMLQQ